MQYNNEVYQPEDKHEWLKGLAVIVGLGLILWLGSFI